MKNVSFFLCLELFIYWRKVKPIFSGSRSSLKILMNQNRFQHIHADLKDRCKQRTVQKETNVQHQHNTTQLNSTQLNSTQLNWLRVELLYSSHFNPTHPISPTHPTS